MFIGIEKKGYKVRTIVFLYTSLKKINCKFPVCLNDCRDSAEQGARNFLTDRTVRDLPYIKKIILFVFVDLILFCVEVPRELKDPSCDLFESVPADHIIQKRAQYISPDLLGSKMNILEGDSLYTV